MPAVISLAGDWDVFGRSELRRRLAPALTADSCIVDFTGFHCGDASFLDELVYMRKVRKAQGRSCEVLVIRPADAIVRKVLQLTQLAGVWPIYESMDAAVAAVNSAGVL
jgi:anti-anti-sigma regulatory factor